MTGDTWCYVGVFYLGAVCGMAVMGMLWAANKGGNRGHF